MSLQPQPENAPKLSPENVTESTPESSPKATSGNAQKSPLPVKPMQPSNINTEVAGIIRQKVTEAAKELEQIMSVEFLGKAIEAETKRRTSAIIRDALKYARNRAKAEKISSRVLADAALDQVGMKRGSSHADKAAKKAPPAADPKGGDNAS